MRVDTFVMQHIERINNKIKKRCKESDGSPQNRDEPEYKTINSDKNKTSTLPTQSLVSCHDMDYKVVQSFQNEKSPQHAQHITIGNLVRIGEIEAIEQGDKMEKSKI